MAYVPDAVVEGADAVPDGLSRQLVVEDMIDRSNGAPLCAST